MTLHLGPENESSLEKDSVPFRVYVGPAFRLVVDLADPDHARFVIAGGNSGRSDGEHISDHYQTWLSGDYYTVTLKREEIDVKKHWHIKAIKRR